MKTPFLLGIMIQANIIYFPYFCLQSNVFMKRILYTVFVAGGTGSRMGAGIPKQFLDLNGIPILQRTMTTFLGAVPDMKVVTVLPRQYFDTWKKLCAVNSFDIPQILVEGGITRMMAVFAVSLAAVKVHGNTRHPFRHASLFVGEVRDGKRKHGVFHNQAKPGQK